MEDNKEENKKETKENNKVKSSKEEQDKDKDKTSQDKNKELKAEIKKERNKEKTEAYMNSLIQKRKKFYISFFVFLAVIILLILFSTVFALIHSKSDKIISNAYIGNVKVGKKTKEEAEAMLKESYDYKDYKLILKLNDYSYELPVATISFDILPDKSIHNAYAIGRTSDLIKNNYTILASYFNSKKVPLEYTYSREKLNEHMAKIEENLPNKLEPLSYRIKEDKLVITQGKEGNVLDKEQLKDKIVSSLILGKSDSSIQIPVLVQKPEKIDIEKIQKEITRKARPVTYDEKTKKVLSSQTGIEFKITLEEAKKIISQNKDTYEIPLNITKPKEANSPKISNTIKRNNIKLPDTLASISTYYDGKDENRVINLMQMTKSVNGTIIMPGEKFSFKKYGAQTAAKGYKHAAGYAGGRAVPMLGGGICQISSALYSLALQTNLKITERYQHGSPVLYMPPGVDASLYYPYLDLAIVNNRKFPIKIIVTTANGVQKMELRGIKEPDDYEIKVTSKKYNSTPFKTVREYDSKLPKGKEEIRVEGIEGYTAEVYKEYYKDGSFIKKEFVSKDVYKPLTQVVAYNK